MGLTVEFVGAATLLVSGETFVIGREGDLVVDANHFLHRQFLTLTDPGGVWLLTNVGDKLSKLGVRGLQGDAGRLASNRRARLAEYALAVRLVTRDDLAVLDEATVVET